MNYQRLAQSRWKSAHLNQWMTAMIVTRKGIRVNSASGDTLTQLRGAWRLYEFIRSFCPLRARELRQVYGYSRFYELYLLWARYEFSADECIDHLTSDLSNTAMAMQVEDVHGLPEWERKGQSMFNAFYKLSDVAYGAPEWFINWAQDSRKLFKRNGYK